jgi:nucleotide-binding universal stress UspA family protein
MFRKILSANDGSDNAFKALEIACDLAARYGAEMHLILIEEVPILPGSIAEVHEAKAGEDKLVRAHIKRAETIAARSKVLIKPHVFTGHVVRAIVDFANDNRFDLVVIGATGHAALHERMLGTRADRIAHMARCPVLIVR